MKLKVEYDVLPSDWSNLFSTFIDGGVGREWWKLVEVQHFQAFKQGAVAGRWIRADYGKDATYEDGKIWRVVLHTLNARGDSCFDGTKWGWKGEGDKVQARYDLGPDEIIRAAQLDPALFVEWIESGERNISTGFDAGCADTIMQLAAFGTLVYS